MNDQAKYDVINATAARDEMERAYNDLRDRALALLQQIDVKLPLSEAAKLVNQMARLRAVLAPPPPASPEETRWERCPKCGGPTQYVMDHPRRPGDRFFACNDVSCGGGVWVAFGRSPGPSRDDGGRT